jgi:hypothetical protein
VEGREEEWVVKRVRRRGGIGDRMRIIPNKKSTINTQNHLKRINKFILCKGE